MPIVSFKVIPITGDPSVSKLVAQAVKVLERHGLDPIVTPDTTIVQLHDLSRVGPLLSEIHDELRRHGARRVVTIVMVDDRYDKPGRKPEELVERVLQHLSRRQGDPQWD